MIQMILRAILLVLVTATLARAQQPAAEAQPAALAPRQAQDALDVLQDPARRDQLIRTLEAIAKAAPVADTAPAAAAPAAPAAAPKAAPISLMPDSLSAQLLMQTSGWIKDISDQIAAAARTLTDFPSLWKRLTELLADPVARGDLLETIWRLALVLGGAWIAERFAAAMLRRFLTALRAARPDRGAGDGVRPVAAPAADVHRAALAMRSLSLLRRLPLALLKTLVELLPVGVFAAVGALLLAIFGASITARLIVVTFLQAYIVFRVILGVVRLLVSASAPQLRLFHIGDQTAAYVEVWARRLVLVAVFGAALAQAAPWFGFEDPAVQALFKLTALVIDLFLMIIVLQCRSAIADAVRAGPDAKGGLAVLRNRFGELWHVVAIFFILASWVVWAIELQNGLPRLLQFLLVTAGVLIVARLLAILVLGALDQIFRIDSDFTRRFPGIEQRANRYYPALRGVVAFVIAGLTLIALLEVWGLDALDYFRSGSIGGSLASALITIAITAVVAAVIWETANAAMDRHLARLSSAPHTARSARVRTMLPILRTTLFLAVLTVFGLTVLSEIGINIAPLLAGAGIVGIAIGFGSQKLVQDLITGLFLLLENAVQVGDWVTVSSLSGTVEELSIRTIRLRAADGSVHIIPFSSVTSVTNANRGIGNAPVSVNVAYDEDTDRVFQTLKDIAGELRRDPKIRSKMLSDLQLWGVDKVEGSAVTITGQIVCTDVGRWDVQREFNRRMKQRFQELGIVLAVPKQSIVLERTAPDEAAKPPQAAEDPLGDLPQPASDDARRSARAAASGAG